MRKRPLLMVEWEDIATYSAWRNEDRTDDVKPVMCYTVGWKMKAPKGKMCVASSRSSIGDCSDRTVIKKVNIKSIKRLE